MDESAGKKRLLTKAAMMASKRERQYKEVEIPSDDQQERPGTVTVRIRKWFAAEHIAFRNSLTDDQGNEIPWRFNNARQLAAAFCWVDDTGARVMQDEDIQAEWWMRADPAFVSSLCYEVEKFNEEGFTIAALRAARKNSSATAGGSPGTESASGSENPTLPSSSSGSAGTSSYDGVPLPTSTAGEKTNGDTVS